MFSALSARAPPTPSTISWCSRISRPRTYRMWVIGRSASGLSGMSVSSSSKRHATDLRQPDRAPDLSTGQLDADPQRTAVRPGNAEQRQSLRVVVGVGVLLVAVGVDGLSEVAVSIEEADPDERDGHVRRRLQVVAGEHAQTARVDAHRLVEPVLGAEVGHRAVEARWPCCAVEPVARRRSPCSCRTGRAASCTRPSGRRLRGSCDQSLLSSAGAARDCGSAATTGRRCAGRARARADATSSNGCRRVAPARRAAGEASVLPVAGSVFRSFEARWRASYSVPNCVIGQPVQRTFAGPGPRLSRLAIGTAMRVAMIASECEPYAKTGGLADVVDALSRALGEIGHEVDVYLPRYRGLEPPEPAERLDLDVPTAFGSVPRRLSCTAQARGYRLRLVDHPDELRSARATTCERRRRLSRQRLPLRLARAHARWRRCAPRAGRSTSSTATTGRVRRRSCCLRHGYGGSPAWARRRPS